MNPASRRLALLFAILLSACQDPVKPNEEMRLEIVEGDDQAMPLGGVLPARLVVRVRAGSDPVAGAAVVWEVVSGGGSVESADATTDGAGIAEASWRLGQEPGEQRLQARIENSEPVGFIATAEYPQPAITAVSPGRHWTGAAGLTITLTGSGFTTASVVRWNGSERATTLVGPITLSAQILPADLSEADTSLISVFTPAPGGGETTTWPFVVEPALAMMERSVAAGHDFACGISTAARAYCWGANDAGQLGDGGGADRFVPTPVAGGHEFVAITAGAAHACALTPSMDAFCWGDNESGQLGTGSTTSAAVPTPVAGGLKFVVLDAGERNTCGLTPLGEAFCWGDNYVGQIGMGSHANNQIFAEPTAVLTQESFSRIATGYTTCGVTRGERAYCWGSPFYGALGNGSGDFDSPQQVAGEHAFRSVAAGAQISCAIDTSSAVYCWGKLTEKLHSYVPLALHGGHEFTDLDADARCGLIPTGDLYCWGSSNDHDADDARTPKLVFEGFDFVLFEIEAFTGCALAADGTVRCWGPGDRGQNGHGSAAESATPTRISTSMKFKVPSS